MAPPIPDGLDVVHSIDVVIANAASLSGAANLKGLALCGFIMPNGWTAAGLSFNVSIDGTNYNYLYWGGSEVAETVDVDQHVSVDPVKFLSAKHVKVLSGTVAVPVNQGAERTIKLLCRPV